MDSFWDFFWFILSFFLLMAYLMVLFQIIGDLFRDKDTSGWLKAVWIFFLIFLPILTSLIYLIVNGRKMTERNVHALRAAQQDQEAYIRQVSGSGASPVRRDRTGQGPDGLRCDLGRGVRAAQGQGAGLTADPAGGGRPGG